MNAQTQPHVLVVDDEPDLRELLTDALEADGYNVTAAGSGKAAIEAAAANSVDFLITDMRLGDCTGLDVIDSLSCDGDIPAVVITGYADASILTEASRRRPLELMTKPLDMPRLQQAVRAGLQSQRRRQLTQQRVGRLRRLAGQANRQRRTFASQLTGTCAELTTAYRALAGQMAIQKEVIAYQNELVAARTDDDVFRSMFRMYVKFTGGVYGLAMVCDENAQLRVAGRFGVPEPDSLKFCEHVSRPMIESLLTRPECTLMDAGEEAEIFDESIRRRLPGLTVLGIPLIPANQELIGVVILYRKGEQPFTDADIKLAEMICYPTALAVRRND